MFPHNFCPIGFLRRRFLKIFPYIYSHVKNVTPPSFSSTFPLGSSIWTNLNIQYLRMPPHKLILLQPNDFWKKKIYKDFFLNFHLCKIRPQLWPLLPLWIMIWSTLPKDASHEDAFLVDWFFQKIFFFNYSKFTTILD